MRRPIKIRAIERKQRRNEMECWMDDNVYVLSTDVPQGARHWNDIIDRFLTAASAVPEASAIALMLKQTSALTK